MITIEAKLLRSLGILLDQKHEDAMLEHLQETLQERVGLAVAELLEDDELKEFYDLVQKENEAELTEWLSDNLPDYKEIIEDEFDMLMGEIANDAPVLAVA